MNHDRLHLTKTKIAKQLRYFPAFLIPAIGLSFICRSLVWKTLSAYVNKPSKVKLTTILIMNRLN